MTSSDIISIVALLAYAISLLYFGIKILPGEYLGIIPLTMNILVVTSGLFIILLVSVFIYIS